MGRGSFNNFKPSRVPELVAYWNGESNVTSSFPNLITGTGIGPLVQATAADRPKIYPLKNGINAIRFDGDQTEDLKVTDVSAFRFAGSKAWYMWHVGIAGPMPATAYLGPNQWAEGGSLERANFVYTPGNERYAITVAIDGTTTAINRFVIPRTTLATVPCIEIFYDGDAATNALKCRCFVNDVEISSLSITGTNPATLQSGDGLNAWISSLNGASNGTWDLVACAVANGHPSLTDRNRVKTYKRGEAYTNMLILDGNSIVREFASFVKPLITWDIGTQNFGVSGHTTAQRRTAYATGAASFAGLGGGKYYLICEIGNHLLGGATESAALDEMIAFVGELDAAGWDVIIGTTPPRLVGAGGWTSDMQTAANNNNIAIRANYLSYGAVEIADYASDSRLSDASDAAIWPDGLHPSDTGKSILAEVTATALGRVLEL